MTTMVNMILQTQEEDTLKKLGFAKKKNNCVVGAKV